MQNQDFTNNTQNNQPADPDLPRGHPPQPNTDQGTQKYQPQNYPIAETLEDEDVVQTIAQDSVNLTPPPHPTSELAPSENPTPHPTAVTESYRPQKPESLINHEHQKYSEQERNQEIYKPPEVMVKPKQPPIPKQQPKEPAPEQPTIRKKQDVKELHVVDQTDTLTQLHHVETRDKLTQIADEEEEKFIQEVEAAHGNN